MKVKIRKRVISGGIIAWVVSTVAEQTEASTNTYLAENTSLSFVPIALAIICPIILFVLYRNRYLQKKVGEHRKLVAESEEQVKLIFEYSPDAVFVVEKDGKLITANSRACEFVKTAKKDLLKKSLYDLVPKEGHSAVKANLEKWFLDQMDQCEGVALAADGSSIPIEMVGRSFQLGECTLLQLHARDISLRRKAEERIDAARQMAEDSKELALKAHRISEEASQSKSEFLASMSHEIRTPLYDIIGMSGLLSDKNPSPEQKNCVETIQASSEGLLKIINHVLDIAKMEAGQLSVREEPFDIWELCKKLQRRFDPQAGAKGLQLSCRCQNTVPLYLVGDGDLVEQILAQLLDNALTYTHEGSISLNIECHSQTPAGVGLYFQVIDTGTGISKEKQDGLFEKSINLGGPENRLFRGFGLAICKQQVELMGGVIGLISSPGHGSTFHFSLSLPQAMDPAAIKVFENNRTNVISRKDTRVLLVEDNKVNQKVGVAILKKIGCQVDAVDNGKYAVHQIRKERYDVVLMDCEMPVLDGFETTAQIRSMREPGCSVPIVAITANAMKDDEKKCIAAGMDDYISKPVSREVLIKMINKHTVDV